MSTVTAKPMATGANVVLVMGSTAVKRTVMTRTMVNTISHRTPCPGVTESLAKLPRL